MSTSLTESHLLEDDKTMTSAIGAGIDERRLQFLLSPKRKLAETGDGAAEKRYRGDETEEQKALGKQGGGCECKGGGEHEMEECECESEGEMEVPDYMVEYYKKISDILGVEVGVGTHGGCDGEEYIDEEDEVVGDKSILFAYPELQKKWPASDPVMCCSYPFNDLDFKLDTKLYSDLKAFGENAVMDLKARYKNYEEPSFQDIEKVSSCPAACNHRVVTLKAIDRSDQALQIVLHGQLPLGDFAVAKPNEFVLLEYCTVR